jgi:hypothetical protein
MSSATTIKLRKVAPTTLSLTVSHPLGRAQLAVVHVKGALDHRTYEQFIACAAGLYTQGKRQLLIDLHQTRRIELAGLFALHSIARLYGGERLLNPEAGWAALKAATLEVTAAMQAGVKLLAPPVAVAQAIQNSSLCRFLEIYDELAPALASFDNRLLVPAHDSLFAQVGGTQCSS